jgi:sarcinarray family protein
LRIITYILILLLITILNQNVLAEPVENEYGSVNAWFNGQESTVENVQLRIGEPVEIKVTINSKIDGEVNLELTNPLITESYEVISGPSKIDDWIDVSNVESGWTETYTWIIKPTGEWTNGNAPINIFVQFHKDINDDLMAEFTIANPYILDEQYSGPAPTRTASDPSSTDQPSSQGSPGFGVAGALLGIALVVMARRN